MVALNGYLSQINTGPYVVIHLGPVCRSVSGGFGVRLLYRQCFFEF